MRAVFHREIGAYFHSPAGYIYLAVFYFFSGFYFLMGPLLQNTADLTSVFQSMFVVALFLIPVLTMRLFSEERRHRTDQALLTAPISLTGLVLGKFCSALAVYLLGLLVLPFYGLMLSHYAPFDKALFWSNFLALLLLGMALIALGIFLSSLTESQITAAVGGFAVALLLLLLDAVQPALRGEILRRIAGAISFYSRYALFTLGVFDAANFFFFLSVCAAFLFLTVQVLERRRWR